MNMPGFTAERSLENPTVVYRTTGVLDGSGGLNQVLPQQYPVDMEECWQRCLLPPYICPKECAYVPWPTYPPPPRRHLKSMLRR